MYISTKDRLDESFDNPHTLLPCNLCACAVLLVGIRRPAGVQTAELGEPEVNIRRKKSHVR